MFFFWRKLSYLQKQLKDGQQFSLTWLGRHQLGFLRPHLQRYKHIYPMKCTAAKPPTCQWLAWTVATLWEQFQFFVKNLALGKFDHRIQIDWFNRTLGASILNQMCRSGSKPKSKTWFSRQHRPLGCAQWQGHCFGSVWQSFCSWFEFAAFFRPSGSGRVHTTKSSGKYKIPDYLLSLLKTANDTWTSAKWHQ